MTTFTIGKSSPNKNEIKTASLAMKSRQQVINEVNKRRTLLQDNSWIKKRPEEENTDENYGKAVLNQCKSQDSLHSSTDEKDDQKAVISRYRSETTLDSKETGISDKLGNATSPLKKKRQSWVPPETAGPKPTTDDMKSHQRHSWTPSNTATTVSIDEKLLAPTAEKSGGLKMTICSSEAISPNVAVSDPLRTRQICPTKPESNIHRITTRDKTERSQNLENLINVSYTDDKGGEGSQDDLIVVKTSTVDQKKKWEPVQGYESATMPGNQSETNHLTQATRETSSNASSSYSGPKDTIVYTRTFENSRFPHDTYEDTTPGKSIRTVYSTSDRTVIEKEMCTYCRKPLGTDTKMILDALQICCHATCFKCEVCKRPMENLKAGDSIWLYNNTVHCTPCYAKVKASWVY